MKINSLPIFVVSLPGSNRRHDISEKLSGYSFQYENAIYGKNLGEDYLQKVNDQQWVKIAYRRDLTFGEVGCALSHKNIYKKIIDQNIPWAIIFEDDISIKHDFYDVFMQKIDTFDSNNIYILGAQEGLVCNDYVILSKTDSIILNEKIRFGKAIDSERYIFRTAAYLISKKVAENILNFTENRFCLADDWSCFKKNNLFKDLYLSNFISHPIELGQQSLLELERNNSIKKNWKTNNPKIYKFLKKIYVHYRKFKYFNK